MNRILAIIIAAISSLTAISAVHAQTLYIPREIRPSMVIKDLDRSEKRTAFDPAVHGFNFANEFSNNFVSELDIRTGGLCGGMVYAALDYWKANRRIPQQSWLPTEGTTLQSYIYNRQVRSIAMNAEQWAELMINIDGRRNDEFWRWGLEGKPGGRIDLLKRAIDKGQPVPLSMRGCSEGCSGDHQILAIGYDMGRYKGDLGAHKNEFKIFVYDPNHPGETLTLIADESRKKYRYAERTSRNWRTYFVDRRWQAANPPTIRTLPREFLITLETGEDDLRGGNDSVNVFLKRGSAPEIPYRNLNNGKRWIMNSRQTVAVSLPRGVTYRDITGIRVEHTGTAGNAWQRVGADNWDLRAMVVESGDADGREKLFERGGTPLHRFTLNKRGAQWDFAGVSRQNEVIFYFFTANDDLRGGNDNVNAVLLLRNGREHRFNTINGRRKWENGAEITVSKPLPRGITASDIIGMRIETTFGGGMGGDNWNLGMFSLKTREGGTERTLLRAGNGNGSTLQQFTGSTKQRTWLVGR